MQFLTSVLFLLVSSSAFACLNNGDLTLCQGDRAVVDNGDGVVIAINPTNMQVSIDFSRGKSAYTGINTYPLSEVSVGKGCLSGYCVGDKAVVENGDGTIIGINPIAQRISIDFSTGKSNYTGINTYSMNEISVGKGCFKGYCVGDSVVVENGDGLLIAINPSAGQGAVDFSKGHSSYTGMNTYDLSKIGIANYCVDYNQDHAFRSIHTIDGFSGSFSK